LWSQRSILSEFPQYHWQGLSLKKGLVQWLMINMTGSYRILLQDNAYSWNSLLDSTRLSWTFVSPQDVPRRLWQTIKRQMKNGCLMVHFNCEKSSHWSPRFTKVEVNAIWG
jgi:hypothetical protein